MLREIWSPPVATREDQLAEPMERLEQALSAPVAGCERTWAEHVVAAVDAVEQAVRQHAARAEDADGLYTSVDLTRPTLVRRVNELRREHGGLLEQLSSLRAEVKRAAAAFIPDHIKPVSVNALPAAPVSGSVPNFGALRQRAQEFLTTLQRHRDAEGDLLLESVNMDFGAGD
jgi:hypothetical protein